MSAKYFETDVTIFYSRSDSKLLKQRYKKRPFTIKYSSAPQVENVVSETLIKKKTVFPRYFESVRHKNIKLIFKTCLILSKNSLVVTHKFA